MAEFKYYVVHRQLDGKWCATYIVGAVSSKHAEDVVKQTVGNTSLHAFSLPDPDPEIILEVWRDQVSA